MGSTVVCGPRQSGDPYTPPPPRLFFVPEFLSCNRCLDIDVDDHFAPLSSRLSTSFVHSTWRFTFIFFRHFSYIFISRRSGSKGIVFSYVSISCIDISRMLVEEMDCSTSRSLNRSNGRKSESIFLSYLVLPSLFVSRCRFPRIFVGDLAWNIRA